MMRTLLLGALGLVLAVATGLAVHLVTRETISLPVVKLEQGGGLAPATAHRRATPTRAATTTRATTASPAATTTRAKAVTTTRSVPAGTSGDRSPETEDNSGPGSANSGPGRGRGRGRSGGTDD